MGALVATSQIGHQALHLPGVDGLVVPSHAVRSGAQVPADLAFHHALDELSPGALAGISEPHAGPGGVIQELVIEHVKANVPGLVVGVAVIGGGGGHGGGRFVHESSIHRIQGPRGLWWTVSEPATQLVEDAMRGHLGKMLVGVANADLAHHLAEVVTNLARVDLAVINVVDELFARGNHNADFEFFAEGKFGGSSHGGLVRVHESSIHRIQGPRGLWWTVSEPATQLSEAEVRGDPGPHHEGVEVDASVGADGPDVQVPHDVAGLSAGEAREALGQLIDRGGHAREALGAAVGVLHESSIHRIREPRGLW